MEYNAEKADEVLFSANGEFPLARFVGKSLKGAMRLNGERRKAHARRDERLRVPRAWNRIVI